MLLIIDPDIANREALIKIFKWVDNRYRVTAVQNKDQGFDSIKQFHYNMVVFDSELFDKMPGILRSACPDSVLIMSSGVGALADSTVDFVISKPPTRLEALVCSRIKKKKTLFPKQVFRHKHQSRTRLFRLTDTPNMTMTFVAGIINDPSARFTIPMAKLTSISAAMRRLGKSNMPYILVRNGKPSACDSSEILKENDVLLLER